MWKTTENGIDVMTGIAGIVCLVIAVVIMSPVFVVGWVVGRIVETPNA